MEASELETKVYGYRVNARIERVSDERSELPIWENKHINIMARSPEEAVAVGKYKLDAIYGERANKLHLATFIPHIQGVELLNGSTKTYLTNETVFFTRADDGESEAPHPDSKYWVVACSPEEALELTKEWVGVHLYKTANGEYSRTQPEIVKVTNFLN